MTAPATPEQALARHAANVAAGYTITCKRCAMVYRKGWGTEDGYCSATCRELATAAQAKGGATSNENERK